MLESRLIATACRLLAIWLYVSSPFNLVTPTYSFYISVTLSTPPRYRSKKKKKNICANINVWMILFVITLALGVGFLSLVFINRDLKILWYIYVYMYSWEKETFKNNKEKKIIIIAVFPLGKLQSLNCILFNRH